MNAFLTTLRSLGAGRLAVVAGTVLATIAFVTYLGARMIQPPMSLLFGGLDTKEASELVAKLDGMRVPYELRGNGSQVLVPEDQVLKLRLALAREGLPSGGSIGYEIFDKTDSLGTTSFVQNINQLRALEGELARTIRSLDGVAAARVHLVLPRREVFARENREPSASVVLKLRGSTRLDKSQVGAIQNLVAAAVPDLKTSRIAIVDDRGTLLTRVEQNGPGSAGSMAEAKLELEERHKRNIETLLERTLGPGKVRAEVTADIDYDRTVTSQEMFDPDQQVVRSVQTVTEQNSSADGASQAVSVQTNLPEAKAQDSAGGGSNSTSSRTEETTNYEISRTTRTQTREAGIVRRLSVAVLVDGNYSQGQDGTRTYQPRSADELQSLATLVRSAVGFDAKRGDTVEIVNLQFPAGEPTEALPEEFALLGLGKADLMRIAETGILGIVALLLILLVIRPVLNRFMTPTGSPLPAGAPQLPPGQAQAQLALPPGAPGTELQPSEPVSEVEKMIDIARIEGQVKASSVKRIGEIVQRHPEEAVSIVRTWMYQDA
ncbi:flagellar basal-body MS-ring/collar protein FliF [Desertibaculum subflavum]|uniref:flagellar basal-body MS-ring/collar protein FliF n=1 Tax=Desertibaculum subflavum TaxID=2268458 RepID=UPI000E662F39